MKKTTKKKKIKTYREVYQEYLHGKIKLLRWQKIGILMLIIVVSGFVGWLWEFSLQEIDGGFQHLYIKGGNLLPWINLYAYGGVMILLMTYKLRKHPWAVFLVSLVGCGLLELFAGWIVYTVGNGTRYWDYKHIWWGWGDINGFVCPVSATIFGLAALLLMYWLVPFCIYLSQKMTRRAFLTMATVMFVAVVTDDITNLTLKNLGLPTAMDFYESIGFKYKT